jgi:hypothetical protein
MFLPYRIAVKEYLVEGANELVLTFPSTFIKGKFKRYFHNLVSYLHPYQTGRELQEEHGKFALWNGDSSRLHVRTAQYTYGWVRAIWFWPIDGTSSNFPSGLGSSSSYHRPVATHQIGNLCSSSFGRPSSPECQGGSFSQAVSRARGFG